MWEYYTTPKTPPTKLIGSNPMIYMTNGETSGQRLKDRLILEQNATIATFMCFLFRMFFQFWENRTMLHTNQMGWLWALYQFSKVAITMYYKAYYCAVLVASSQEGGKGFVFSGYEMKKSISLCVLVASDLLQYFVILRYFSFQTCKVSLDLRLCPNCISLF